MYLASVGTLALIQPANHDRPTSTTDTMTKASLWVMAQNHTMFQAAHQ